MLCTTLRHQIAGPFVELVRSLNVLHMQAQFSFSSQAGDDANQSKSSTSNSSSDPQGKALAEFHRKVAALQGGQGPSSVTAWLSASASTEAAADEGSRGGSELVSPDYGYAVLGGVDPEASQQVAGAQQPKLHPARNFDVRDMTYSPLDLSPLSHEEEEPWVPQMRRGPRDAMPALDEVQRQLDYKNIEFLLNFVTASGRIKSRRQTRLKPRMQSRVARTVKLARQMALLPYEMRVGDGGDGDRWRRMREFRAAQAGGSQQ